MANAKTFPQCAYVSATPDQARAWLEKPAKNRKISQRRVGLYAAAMKRGDWMLTNQGIAIDEFGMLIDGQHRLNAVIEADVPVELLVIRATPNRSQLVLDQGLKRSPHDQVGLREGWEVTPMHIAVAKCIVMSVGGPGSGIRKDTTADIQLMDRLSSRSGKDRFAIYKKTEIALRAFLE